MKRKRYRGKAYKRPRKVARKSTYRRPKGRSGRNIRTGGFLGIELKYFDTTYAATAVSDTMAGAEAETATYGLFCPQQGDTAKTRDGNRCMVKSIMLRGSIKRGQAGDLVDVRAGSVAMIAVILDKQTNASQMSAEDCFDDSTQGANDEAYCFRKIENSPRFEVLWKKYFNMNDMVAGTDGANTNSVTGNIRFFQVYINRDILVNFVGNAGTVADLSNNSIHVVAISNTSYETLEYAARVRFVG